MGSEALIKEWNGQPQRQGGKRKQRGQGQETRDEHKPRQGGWRKKVVKDSFDGE